jgi:predicted alpha-1,2-mannosidase
VRPRNSDGSFLSPFDPASTSYKEFYEGSAVQYSTFVPHDVQGLINRTGGDAQYVAWLDSFFDGRYNAANEVDILAPYPYVHAGRPDRTNELVRQFLATRYNDTRDGLPGSNTSGDFSGSGNDDAGAISAWYVWGAMGLYPNAGQPYYYVGSPIFESVKLDLGGGKELTVEAPGTSETNKYVRSATLNGQRIDRAFVNHDEIKDGGTLVLEMGPEPSPSFGKDVRPPSVSGEPNGLSYHFDNQGVSADADASLASFDSGGMSYSREAMAGAGLVPGP